MSWFLATFTARGKSLRRARLVVQFGFGFGLYCICFVPILLLVSAPEAALCTFLSSSTMLLVPFILRWGRSVPMSSTLLVAAIACLFTGTTVTLGGLDSPTTPCLAIAPIVALFLLGPRPGAYWSILVTLLVGGLYGLEVAKTPFPLLVDADAVPFLDFAGFITVVGVSLVFLLNYDSAQRLALKRMSRFNRRMVEMISHLEATSTALSKSATEFYGDTTKLGVRAHSSTRARTAPGLRNNARHNAGLTQQMLEATVSGREMIVSVDESFRGMIQQYKVISQRIAELYQQSGIIEDMVHTIDSISNRLDLMALNTGIEAEHAGVYGRNFKLLAGDMRRLAERVLSETSRIKNAIRKVQDHTTAALSASQAGQVLTDESVSQLDLMSSTFDDIYALVERTATASKQLTNDTATQLTTIYDLVNTSLETSDREE